MTVKGTTRAGDAQRQKRYVDNRVAGMTPPQAARAAGYKAARHCEMLESKDSIRMRIARGMEANMSVHRHTREGVLETIDDAIGMARLIADPSSMIRGAQEINKMQGHYAPELKEIMLVGEEAQRQAQIGNMTEAQLLKELGKEPAYIDAEFEEVKE